MDAVVPEQTAPRPLAAVSPMTGLVQVAAASPKPSTAATAKKVVALLKKMLKEKEAALRTQQAAAKAQQVNSF